MTKTTKVLRLREERLRRGWSQTELAFYAHLSASDISKMETGRFLPFPAQAARLAEVLGMAAEALLEEVEA